VKLSNSFRIDRPVPEVYDAFLDVQRIATCMPGSRLLGEPQPGTYEGEVKVKVGPLGVAYTGQFTILEADEAARVLTMRAKGREQRGAGNADAHIVATLQDDGTGTLVQIDTDLSIRGKVAQFGRGAIGDVTDEIMRTFANNVEQMLASGGTPGGNGTGTGNGTGPTAPAPTAASSGTQQQPPPEPPAATPGPAEQTTDGELDAWSLIVRPMLRRHAATATQVVLSGVVAYVAARAGARAAVRAAPPPPRYLRRYQGRYQGRYY
jgi:uncharacterized protein